jgi:Transposase DDE domain/Insertion element 4 transposase N-terminal
MRSSGPFLRRLTQIADQTESNSFFGAVPSEFVDQALAEAGKDKNRHGVRVPHWLALRLLTCMFFLRDLSIQAVLDRVAAVLGTPANWKGEVPNSSLIAKARDRLGQDVLKGLFRRFADFLADEFTCKDRWLGYLVVAIDGTTLRMPDSEDNVAEFGRPGGRNGSGGFPQLRLVTVVSALSHFVLGAVVGPCKGKGTGELSLVKQLLGLLQPDWITLMDRGFCSYPLLQAMNHAGKLFMVRKPTGKTSARPKKVGRPLRSRKDWWVDYLPNSRRYPGGVPLRLRWLRFKTSRGRWVEFLTNLDPELFPYEVLKDLYLQRWEVEFVFREIKTHLVGKKVEFRSMTPNRVRQELLGMLVAYNAIRLRIAEAANLSDLEPRELSFSQSLLLLQLAALNAVPVRDVLCLLASYRIQKRPPRNYERVVKVPQSKFAANPARARPCAGVG